ncbi:MAG: PSD1 and planctomycete cytochrome C domain-containing protein [Isosphaeraceae bacterium]|nr:PSD1 and planctomycete cytochrome C domain-containing protein [Isosphaeraceae bacterium]
MNLPNRIGLWIVAVALPLIVGSGIDANPARADEPSSSDTAAERFFRDQALPVLRQYCFECHSHATKKAKGGLVLDSRSGWEQGGESGPAIVPGKPEESLLIQAVRYGDLEMPPKGKLPAAAIATLERWVKDGAADPRVPEPSASQAGGAGETGRNHWAFQPIRPESPPPRVHDSAWPLDDVDRYVLARLEERALRPAADADRYTWLRRVSLDLTGLPPTPQEIAAFRDDSSPRAHEHVVDRLLGSRAFGERWGRHWLDLVGYADQIGTANDIFAEHAWRYRDYVIDAFNADVPYDRFIHEQIAGDLLPHGSAEQRARQLVATGFLLLGDLAVVEADKAKLRIDVVDQQVDKVGRAFLGMTIACARCHDHKFDPIPQRDYYALAGIFHSTDSVRKAEWGVWSWPALADLPETEAQQTEREAREERHRQRVDALKADREHLREQKKGVDAALAKPANAPGDDSARTALVHVQNDLAAQLAKLDSTILHAEFFAPARPRAFVVRDLAHPADMKITIRGNAHALGALVPRGYLRAASVGPAPSIPPAESGRRQLAGWIASPANPLTARVAVNRIWQKLFGEGIVRSVDYFGLRGEAPSHPELLDHLARRFVSGGWSQKGLIRSLVLSRTYRQSSRSDARTSAADPDNRLFGRMNRRRLDAEALRDALLAVSGRLIACSGGPSLPLEYRENTGNLEKGAVNPPSFRLGRFRPEQEFVRTVYLPVIRSAPQAGPAELRNVFDFTQPAEFAGQRSITAVPTQALFLMNSKFMKDRAVDLARRVVQGPNEEKARLEALWLRAFNRPITDAETSDARTFLSELRTELAGEKNPEPELRSWVELCHSLLASNEFLMRL